MYCHCRPTEAVDRSPMDDGDDGFQLSVYCISLRLWPMSTSQNCLNVITDMEVSFEAFVGVNAVKSFWAVTHFKMKDQHQHSCELQHRRYNVENSV
jgi:hypothetical protein